MIEEWVVNDAETKLLATFEGSIEVEGWIA